MNSNFSVSSCLEKMENRDPDFRMMAVHDLQNELENDRLKLDANSEKKLTSKTLSLLTDRMTTVQDTAVKCLGPLSKRVKEPILREIVDVLCKNLVDTGKESGNIRDVASIGIRNVIDHVPLDPPSLSQAVYSRLTPKLLEALSDYREFPDIIFNALDALSQLMERFGASHIYNVEESQRVLEAIQPHLSSQKTTARKKAVMCLGFLAASIPDKMFSDLVTELLGNIKNEKKVDKLRTFISAIGAIAKSVGYRLGPQFLAETCPILLTHVQKQEDDELREQCFSCLEILLFRCPKDMTPYVDQIQSLGLEYMAHDPNWVEDDEEEEAEEEEDEEDQDDDEDFSDDEDMSWKVRRSAAKCLSMIIQTRPDLINTVYAHIAPALITRFKEREINVKGDIFAAFGEVLKQTQRVAKRSGDNSVFTKAEELAPKAVKAISKQLKEKQISIRIAAFSLLREMVAVLPGVLGGELAANLVPGIKLALANSKKTSPQLKIECLHFLRLYFHAHAPEALQQHIAPVAPLLYAAATDSYFRTAAEGLRVCAEFTRILRPNPDSKFDFKPYISGLFDASVKKLEDQTVDQEVKEAAITCHGLIVAAFSDQLGSKLGETLAVLANRLSNEITRLTAVKAFEMIARSALKPELSSVLGDVLKQLASFLRKADRQLRQSSLLTLSVLIQNYGSQINSEQFEGLINELVLLVSESDLHLTHLALDICTAVVSANKGTEEIVIKLIFPKLLALLQSQLLQGLAAESVFALLAQLAQGAAFQQLLSQVLGAVPSSNEQEKDISKQVLTNIARAAARLTTSAPADQRQMQIKRFIAQIVDPRDESQRQLALYAIGDIGRSLNLEGETDLDRQIVAVFESPNEESRQAASHSLGNVACGNLEAYLPKILAEIQKNPKISYLLIHSLREIIVKESSTEHGTKILESEGKDILPLLFTHCQNKEEGTRNVVAECLGKFTLASPEALIPKLVENVGSQSPEERATIVTSLKFAVSEKSQAVDKVLLPHLPKFFSLIKDTELNVRHKALLTLNFFVHNKANLVRDLLPDYLDGLYSESIVKSELIYEVDLGPFKHKVDGGLEARKAAFETMYVLLESCLDKVELGAFVRALARGLSDVDDIKMLSHLMLGRLAHLAPSQLLEFLDELVDPLNETVTTKPKEGAVKQDIEKNDEIIKSALRAILLCSHIPNVESREKFSKFFSEVVKVGELGEKVTALESSANDLMEI